jgi:sigma-B regulation protein RsbU (phosphoserine phosphatase)
MCCDPAEALNQANDIIVQNNPANMFVTLAAGLFDPQSGMLTYANAGHTPPLLIGKGYENPDQGIALGLFEDAGIVNETIHLDPGDGMLFYTDGATEANNADRAFFGEERLAAAVCGATCPADAVSAAVDAVEAFVEDCEQFDDLTLLSIFAREPEVVAPKTVWEDSTKPDTLYLEVLRQHLLPCFETKEQGLKAMLACDEVFTNIAMYSDATIVDVQIQQDEHEVRIRFSDDGVPFDPVSSEPEDCDFEDLDIGGMGIQLVRQTCSDMSYERLDDRNILTLHFAR